MEFFFSPLLMPTHLCIYRLLKLAKSGIETKEQLDLEQLLYSPSKLVDMVKNASKMGSTKDRCGEL